MKRGVQFAVFPVLCDQSRQCRYPLLSEKVTIMQMSSAIPQSLLACMTRLLTDYQRVLGENLRGLYVHGSIAMKCFNADSSDVDVLVVVQSSLSLATKRALGSVHVALAETCPNPLELSVVLQSVLDDFSYPPPFEFHPVIQAALTTYTTADSSADLVACKTLKAFAHYTQTHIHQATGQPDERAGI